MNELPERITGAELAARSLMIAGGGAGQSMPKLPPGYPPGPDGAAFPTGVVAEHQAANAAGAAQQAAYGAVGPAQSALTQGKTHG